MVEEVVVRAGERREVGRALLGPPLGERRAAVEDEADHRDDRDERQGEDDDDLTAGAVLRGLVRSGHGGHSAVHWIETELVDCRSHVPVRPRSGVIGE